MKHIFLLLLLSLICNFSFAQTIEEKTLTNASIFSARSGTLFLKEFIEIGEIRLLKVNVIKMKDLNSGDQISFLNFELPSGLDKIIASLDKEEVDGLLSSVSEILLNVINTTASVYTEYIYRSKEDLKLVAYCKKGQSDWTIILKLNNYDFKALFGLRIDDLNKFIEYLQRAKKLMIN